MDMVTVKYCKIGFSRPLRGKEVETIKSVILGEIDIPADFRYIEQKQYSSIDVLTIPQGGYSSEVIEGFCGRLLGFCLASGLELDGKLIFMEGQDEVSYIFDGITRCIDVRSPSGNGDKTYEDMIESITENTDELTSSQLERLYKAIGAELIWRVNHPQD